MYVVMFRGVFDQQCFYRCTNWLTVRMCYPLSRGSFHYLVPVYDSDPDMSDVFSEASVIKFPSPHSVFIDMLVPAPTGSTDIHYIVFGVFQHSFVTFPVLFVGPGLV